MKQIRRKNQYYVYIVECTNGTYYTGYTNNLENRIKEHNKGHGSKYLRGKGPIKLVWCKEYGYYKRAVSKEREIKKLTHKQKQELVGIYERAACKKIS
ncbi:MAG: GIY-YIG nuclease family protein [Candidatus Omnitrophica bacterium]|nr:GIY-YIG nuclease family protein [Candidatus Omnitrophota bacterium]MBU4458015.1 GIY-YIG nuclease family protein [Candidatus Omnitrophota bacterium]